ncbi:MULTISPECIES: MFS transporter [Kitasatospora]|uniref:Major facilitator superfamily (MFS) profile domain-containing protein n=1 Tax=Kitasatospora cystarginea TaxID=58350 RepID=A0ABP5QJV1_9ACTN
MINRNFTLIWVGQALSDMASEMTSLALPLAVLAETRSPAATATVATAVGIAQLAAKLPAGLLADTHNRKHLMLLCDAARAVIALLLAFALAEHRLTTGLAVGAAAASAAISAVFFPAEAGVLRQAVPTERRREAITRNVVRTNIAIAIGPPLGGLLLQCGAPIAFLADAASYLVSFGLVLQVAYRHVPRPATAAAEDPARRGRSALRASGELTVGFSWLMRNRGMLVLVLVVAYLNLLGRAIELLASIGVSDLGREPVSAGVVLTAAGCGGIVGGLCTGWLLRRLTPMLILAGTTAAWLLLTPLVGTGIAWISALAVGLLVFTLPPLASLAFLVVSLDTPPHLQGRAGAAVQLVAVSIAWAGPGLAGFLITANGGPLAALELAAPLALPLLAATSPRLRALVNSLGRQPDSAKAAAELPPVAPVSATGQGGE